ncbi:MAG: VOC family protein [Chloroflexi bacterium]|nr:VOC family protein [Chloroflexota bacterium]
MFTVTKYPHATFCWADVSTTDTAAGKAFYTALFGWDAEDLPMGDGMFYTMFRKDGQYTAALSPMQPEMQAQGVPAHWQCYISVDDVDAAAAKVTELGGTVMMSPFEVFDSGRMAVIADPTGAPVMLWQARNHIGAGLINTVGAMSWNELQTRDTAAAAAFFKELFGWESQSDPEGSYFTFSNKGRRRMAGGMRPIAAEWGAVPPNWMPYFSVADCAESIAKVKELGGNVMVGPMESPGVGTLAVVQDPQGGVCTVIALLNPEPAWE